MTYSDLTPKDQRVYTVLTAIIRQNHCSGVSRTILVVQSRIPRTSVFDSLIKLELFGKVERYTKAQKRKGRPITYWRIV